MDIVTMKMNYVIGQNVVITKLKNGYWIGETGGTFQGVAKNGRIRVKTYLVGIRCYAPENVKPK